MRFFRGLGIGILMFIGWIVFSVLATFDFIGEYGLGRDFDLALVSPIYSIPMVIGFFGMFIGPIYYWVIEPLRERGTSPRQRYVPPSQPSLSQGSGQQVASFCQKCGTENPNGQQFCGNCGVNLVLA